MRQLWVGSFSIENEKGLVYIDKPTINKLSVNSLVDYTPVIDLDNGRITKHKLKKLLSVTKDIICITRKELKAKSFKSLFDDIQYLEDSEVEFNIFELLKDIFTGRDRNKVFNTLSDNKPSLRYLIRWLNSNIDIEDEENFRWIQKIDQYLERVSNEIVYHMISLISPRDYGYNRFYFKRYSGDRK